MDSRGHLQESAAHLDRHHDLFQSGISGALSDSIDRAFDLTRPVVHARQRVRDRKAEIVMAVHAERNSVDPRQSALNVSYQPSVLIGHAVADRVRDIDDGRARFDDGIKNFTEVIDVGTPRVLRGELDVVAKTSREPNGLCRQLQSFGTCFAELVFQMDIAGGKDDMNP